MPFITHFHGSFIFYKRLLPDKDIFHSTNLILLSALFRVVMMRWFGRTHLWLTIRNENLKRVHELWKEVHEWLFSPENVPFPFQNMWHQLHNSLWIARCMNNEWAQCEQLFPHSICLQRFIKIDWSIFAFFLQLWNLFQFLKKGMANFLWWAGLKVLSRYYIMFWCLVDFKRKVAWCFFINLHYQKFKCMV